MTLTLIEIKLTTMNEEVKKKRVSYSQFSNWFNCPHRWMLDHVKGLRVYEDSVHTCFGTAVHETIQLYIETLYKKSVSDADDFDLNEKFKAKFDEEIARTKILITEIEKQEFVKDGKNIITSFSNVSNRIKHFPSNRYEFVAVEDEIVMPIKNNVEFVCYIDLILRDKSSGRYRIIDIKTSTNAWNQAQKDDPAKFSQVLLYKAFFSKKYNVPMNMIDVEFFILKRKLYEGVSYPQSRIQTFIPKHTEKAVTNILSIFSQFIGDCFKTDGTFNDDLKKYPKIPGKAKKNCKYCPHKKIHCDAKADFTNKELDY